MPSGQSVSEHLMADGGVQKSPNSVGAAVHSGAPGARHVDSIGDFPSQAQWVGSLAVTHAIPCSLSCCTLQLHLRFVLRK